MSKCDDGQPDFIAHDLCGQHIDILKLLQELDVIEDLDTWTEYSEVHEGHSWLNASMRAKAPKEVVGKLLIQLDDAFSQVGVGHNRLEMVERQGAQT